MQRQWSGWDGSHVGWMRKKAEVNSGCRRRSSTLTAGQRREMGRLLVPKSSGFQGMGLL